MSMTEEQAWEKSCCGPPGSGAANPEGNRRCMASDCAAWRWVVTPEDERRSVEHRISHDPMEACGYCGLAGKP